MGMFDMLKCEYPLPARTHMQDRTFQTKSLDCCLDRYTIRADGTLSLEKYDGWGETIPRIEPSRYTGEIRFYASDGKQDNAPWVEFCALFSQGTLIDLVDASRGGQEGK